MSLPKSISSGGQFAFVNLLSNCFFLQLFSLHFRAKAMHGFLTLIKTVIFGITDIFLTNPCDIPIRIAQGISLLWTNNLFLSGLQVPQGIMFDEKIHSINWKLDSKIKSSWTMIFKIHRFSSMSFSHSHCLG